MGGQDSEVSDGDDRGAARGGQLRADRRSCTRPSGSASAPRARTGGRRASTRTSAEPAAVLASRLLVDLAGAELAGGDRRARRAARAPGRPAPARADDRVIGLEVARGGAAGDPRAARVRGRRRVGRDRADVARARRHARDRPRRGGRARRPRPRAAHDAAAARRRRPPDEGAAAAPRSSRTSSSAPASRRRSPGASSPTDPDPSAIRLPDPMTADQAILRTTLLHGPRRGRAGERRCRQRADRALRARPRLPADRRAAARTSGGASAGSPRAASAARAGAVEALYDALHLELRGARGRRSRTSTRARRRETDAGWFGELHPALLEGDGASSSSISATLFDAGAGADRVRGRDHVPAVRQDIAVVGRRGRRGRSARRRRPRGGRRRAPRGARLRRLPRRAGRRGPEVRALHLAFQSPERTLSDDDAARVRTRDRRRRSPSGSGERDAARLSDGSVAQDPARRRIQTVPCVATLRCRRATRSTGRRPRSPPRRAARSSGAPSPGDAVALATRTRNVNPTRSRSRVGLIGGAEERGAREERARGISSRQRRSLHPDGSSPSAASHASATGVPVRRVGVTGTRTPAPGPRAAAEQAPDPRLVEPAEEPPRPSGPPDPPRAGRRKHELLACVAHVHRPQDAGRLGRARRAVRCEAGARRLPVAREAPLERRPLIDELHGVSIMTPVSWVSRRAAGTVEHHRRRLSRQPW